MTAPATHTAMTQMANYLIRRTPTAQQLSLYERSAERIVPAAQDKTFAAALQHPSLFPYLDAHDAFFKPNSALRQHLYLAFSILEASPEFRELFLPSKHSPLYLIALAGIGMRSVWRLLVGTCIVKVRGL